MDMLGLKDIKMTGYKEKDIEGEEYLIIDARQPEYTAKCPYCGSMPRPHETQHRDIRDFDAFDKKVIINLEVKKYQCLNCKKYFTESFSEVDPRSHMTKRLRDKISYEAFDYSFAELERRYGFSDTMIKNAFAYWQKEMDQLRSKHLFAPKVLGVDETGLCDGMRGVVVDIENNKLLELMEDKKINSFTAFFDQLQNIENVKIVNMDMSGGYKAMAYDYFGKDIIIIVDKYHMVARINKAFNKGYNVLVGQIEDKSDYSYITNRMSILRHNYEDLNKDDRKILAKLIKAIPGLDGIYKLKESFRAIYLNENKEDAKEALSNWLDSIPDGPEYKDFRSVAKTIRSWMTEILNYFKYPYTNAFTEGFNNLMKRTNRIGNGYSFKVLRGKMLYGSSKTSFYSVKEIIKNNDSHMEPYTLGYYIGYSAREPEIQYKAEERFGVDIDEMLHSLYEYLNKAYKIKI